MKRTRGSSQIGTLRSRVCDSCCTSQPHLLDGIKLSRLTLRTALGLARVASSPARYPGGSAEAELRNISVKPPSQENGPRTLLAGEDLEEERDVTLAAKLFVFGTGITSRKLLCLTQ